MWGELFLFKKNTQCKGIASAQTETTNHVSSGMFAVAFECLWIQDLKFILPCSAHTQRRDRNVSNAKKTQISSVL